EFNDLQQAVVAGDESACLLTAVIFSRAQSGTDKERAEVLAQMMSSCDASSWRDVEEGQAEKRRRVSLPDASEPVDELPVGEEDTVGLEERFAAFGDYVEDPEEEPPSDGDFCGHVVRWEPVNVTAIEEALNLDAVRRLENCDCFGILLSIRQRAVGVRNGVGHIPVLQRECRHAPGLRARWCCGVGDVPEIPSGLKDKEAIAAIKQARDDAIARLPRVFQSELKKGIPPELVGRSAFAFYKLIRYICRSGMDIVEVDCCNAYFQFLSGRFRVCEELGHYVSCRDAVLEMIGKAFDVPRVEAKKLIISIGFGGSLHLGAVSWLHRLEDGISKTLRECEAVLSPEARQWHKDRNLASKCFSVYQDAERALLDRMQAAAGARLVSLEHDGVAVYADAAERVRDACGSTHVKATPMPKWEEFAAEHHANFDWSVASDLHFLDFAALKERCRRHVRSSRARQNNADFARLVVANLKPVAHVPAELGEKRTCFELFASTGFWETRHKDDLVTVVSNILKRLMMPFDGRDTVPPEPLNDLAFASSICNAVMAGLAGGNRLPTLDGDRGRDKILFSDGVLLNLPDLSQRKARPSDRMGVRAEATSATWSPTNPSDIFDQVLAFLETRAQGLEDNEQGRKVIESFQQLASDGCELDDNYATMLPGSYVVVGGQSDKNGPTENIAQLESKRLVWSSEVPEHTELQVDFLKAYAEQGGAPITGRRCHGHARSFVPQGILCMTSNFPPRVKTHEDEGWCDDTLKARIAKGLFSPQLLFFVKGLYTSLGPKYNPGTELIPKPVEMRELEIEMTAPPGDDNKPSVNSFLAAKCERAATQSHATPFNDFLKALKLFLGLQGDSEGRAALHRAGIRSKGVGTRRVAVDNVGAWSIKQG
ncbi:unnamed protein product, partial [Effrenium voratum]